MPLSPERARNAIDAIVDGYRAAVPSGSVFSSNLTAGKIYEGWVLCNVLERLATDEGYKIELPASATITLKSSPGPINRSYPCFRLTKSGAPTLEVWTDVEFLTMSRDRRFASGPLERGDYHELDVVVVPEGCSDRPRHVDIRIGVECKHTGYRKELLRAILGVRRELSLLGADQPTGFDKWPRRKVPAGPPSCLLVYSTSDKVRLYDTPGEIFGIDFFHEGPP